MSVDEHVPPAVLRIHNAFTRYAKCIMLFWVLAMLIGGYFSTYFINKAEDRLTAPFHSRAAKEHREFFRLFPELSQQDVLIVYAESSDRTIVCPENNCKRKCPGTDARVGQLFSFVVEDVQNAFPGEIEYISYYNVSGTNLDAIKCQFASTDGRATFAVLTYNPVRMSKVQIHRMIERINKRIHQFFHDCDDGACSDLKAGLTGVDVLAKEGSDSTEKQLFTVDTFTMPVAFFIFYVMVRSWRLLLLCIWNMIITVATSFGTLSFFVKVLHLRPMSVQATFAQALAVSMSIDYSLFLLRRFRDESKNGREVDVASKVMLGQAGHVVVLSCGTFMLVFVGFLFLPSHDLMALGEVAVVTLLFALTVNVTNTVAALHVFPSFFSQFTFTGKTASVTTTSSDTEVANGMNAPLLRPTVTGKPRFRRGAPYKGVYFKFLKTVTTFPYNLFFIVTVYALFIPLAMQAMRLQHNQNAVQITPKSAEGAKIYDSLQEHFSPGLLGQFQLIVTSESIPAMSKPFFDFTYQVIDEVAKETDVPLSSFLSPLVLNGKKIAYMEAKSLRDSNSLLCRATGDLCSLYQYVWNRAVNPQESAIISTIQVPFNPYSRLGIDFVLGTRKAVDAMMVKHPQFQVLFTGNEVDFYEDMEVAFGSMPALITITLLVVFSLLGVGFRSAFIPIRLSLTVFIPLAAVFGTAVLVYQDGLLKWLNIDAFMPTEDGFFWFIPLVCLFQALGLVLDYDIFLVHRVQEHRESGYDIQSAIMKATWEVQSTIVSAGLIMASVFGGILLSDEIAIDQFGFLMCFSVLVDTFVVQCFLIGPILSLGDRFSWWPRVMPMENLITIEDEEFSS